MVEKEIVIKALLNAKRVHDQLGVKGLELVKKKRTGGPTLLGDWEAEEAVLATLKEAGIPIRVYSEEHGIVNLSKNPEFTGILDGIDGSIHYKNWFRGIGSEKSRYAALFAIFNGINPAYDDLLVSGSYEYLTNRVVYAVASEGAYVIDKEHPQATRIYSSGQTKLTQDTKIVIDGFFDINRKTFADRLTALKNVYVGNPQTGGYSGIAYADIARGQLDLCLECTRKGNLEIAFGYPPIKEAGGDIYTLDKKSIGPLKFLQFGQRRDEHIPAIAAATPQLAGELIDYISGKV